MKIAIVGYGKMGHRVRAAAEKLGHKIAVTVDVSAEDADVKADGADSLARAVKSSGAEGAIEFSCPSAVMGNVRALLALGIPIVVGTTGWASGESEIAALAAKTGGTVLRSSNFSTGVNMFYKIVEEAARLLSRYDEYDMAVWEMHHNQKADSPSGTALEIARRVMAANPRKTEAVADAFHQKPLARQLHVSSARCGATPGTHTVFFDSDADTIELTHRARNRDGFALGAVRALVSLDSALKNGTLARGALYGLDDIL